MARFLGEFFPPDLQPAFLRKVLVATLGDAGDVGAGHLLAAAAGLLLALPASRLHAGDAALGAHADAAAAQRAALGARTGVGQPAADRRRAGPASPARWRWRRTPPACSGGCSPRRSRTRPPARPRRCARRASRTRQVFLYATLPQVLPQLMSYTLYRWENNIRAAAVLGVVGAGGLGQLLAFHMGLFHMGKTATVLIAMLLLVALVDALSHALRRWMTR